MVITNTFGAVTSAPAVLNITPVFAPVIRNQPVSLTLLAGSNATFSVGSRGTAPFNYQWVWGGVALPSNDAPTLTVTNATLADAGNYFVQVFNSAGLASSASATLTVHAPPVFVVPPQDRTVLQVATTNFTAEVTSVPAPVIAWFKNGVRLTYSAGYTAINTTNLIVLAAQSGQAGSYVVVATNVAGAVTSAPVTLTVLLTPAITLQPRNVTPTRTDYAGNVPVTLNVAATGAAPLHYQWHFNGGELPGQTNAALVLTNIARLHNGLYQAVVRNVAGAATSSNALVRVWVSQQPMMDAERILRDFDRTTVFLGSNLGDGSCHSTRNLPVLLAAGGFKRGQHLPFDQQNPPPLCNLYVSMLQRLDIEADKFGTSTGTFTGLELSRG